MLSIVRLRIDMLCVFILSFVFLSDDILSIGMLSIISFCRYAENHYTENCYTKYLLDRFYVKDCNAEYHLAPCNYADYQFALCCHEECHYAERHGATSSVAIQVYFDNCSSANPCFHLTSTSNKLKLV
jgi:hypothetical protein